MSLSLMASGASSLIIEKRFLMPMAVDVQREDHEEIEEMVDWKDQTCLVRRENIR
jgi:hypothetical protein